MRQKTSINFISASKSKNNHSNKMQYRCFFKKRDEITAMSFTSSYMVKFNLKLMVRGAIVDN